MSNHPVIVGRSECVEFVELDGLSAPSKIDTGAYRSSIHATNIHTEEQDGEEMLVFTLLGHPSSPETRIVRTTVFDSLRVRSSNGHVSTRYEVKLRIKLGTKIFTTSFTLSDRGDNLYPVLIGRTALKNRFFVDVTKAAVDRLELKKLNGQLDADEEDLE